MMARRSKMKMFQPDVVECRLRARSEILSSTLKHGAMWERQPQPELSLSTLVSQASSESERSKIIRRWLYDHPGFLEEKVSAVRTPSAQSKYQGRQGARAVREIEHAANSESQLVPAAATAYRATSARCNDLAQAKPDIAFSAKELCRDFSVPTLKSLEKLKRLMRDLKLHPRLVYRFPWQSPTDSSLIVNVDTDFAGCRVTRRSTRGGSL